MFVMMPGPEEKQNAIKRSFQLGCRDKERVTSQGRAIALPSEAFERPNEVQRRLESTWCASIIRLHVTGPVDVCTLMFVRQWQS